MKKPDGGPAFPRPYSEVELTDGHHKVSFDPQSGLTLRDWFAGQACVLMGADVESSATDIAKSAYRIADAMLAERDK